MKMLTGFVEPSAGTATVCGHDIQTDGIAARRKMGYLPEGAPCYAEMTPASFLEFVADVRELSGERRQKRLQEVIEQLHLGPVLKQSIETLSKGFKRRVGLAQAILHDPDVLILDEPTDGLDPNQKHEVRELIRSMSSEKLIIISTHILEEVDAVCSRAIIISAGKILADAAPRELASRSRHHNAVKIRFDNAANFASARTAVRNLASVSDVETNGEELVLVAIADRGNAAASAWREVSELATKNNWGVSELQLETGRLDDVFRQITQGELA
jgi:ABC-2 type transport system ATP-binding protein